MSDFEVLIPTSRDTPRQQEPLAGRLPSVQGRRIAVVRTMPPGSGIEELATRIRGVAEYAGAHAADIQRRDFLVDDPAERQDIVAGHDAVIVVAGPSATVVEVSIRYAAEMDAAGTPAVVLFPRNYSETAHYASARATASVRILPAPELGGGMNAGTPALALLALTAPLTEAERFPDRNRPDQNQPRTLHGPDRTALVAEFHDQGWTDGLPVELPTVTAVERMLSGTSLNADLLVTGTFRPEARPVTVRDVAVNAVMAGALPEHLPAILAGAALMGRQVVDSMTRSVNSFAFAQYIGGPYAAKAGVTGGLNALGPGTRANAAIGRCLNLMVRNLGGARTGVNSTPAQGNAASWAFAFAENGEQSPWTPLQQDFGIGPGQSSLTLYGGGFCHFGNFYYGGLDEIAAALAAPDLPSGALVLVSAKRAHQLAGQGYTREGLQDYLYRRVTRPLGELRQSGFYPLRKAMTERTDPDGGFGAWPREYLTMDDDAVVPIYGPGGIQVAVVGSDASSLAQVWIMGRLGTACIDDYL